MIHLASKVPNFIRFLFSKALDVQEEAWNAYPYCRTVITNPGYMKDNAYIKIETLHAQDAGTNENAHNLPKNLLEKRKVRMPLIHTTTTVIDRNASSIEATLIIDFRNRSCASHRNLA